MLICAIFRMAWYSSSSSSKAWYRTTYRYRIGSEEVTLSSSCHRDIRRLCPILCILLLCVGRVCRSLVAVVDNLIVMGYLLGSLGIVEMDCYCSVGNVMTIEQFVYVVRFQIPSMMVVLRICS